MSSNRKIEIEPQTVKQVGIKPKGDWTEMEIEAYIEWSENDSELNGPFTLEQKEEE